MGRVTVWLWQDSAHGVRYWSDKQTGVLAYPLPAIPDFTDTLTSLRGSVQEIQMRHALQPDLTMLLESCLKAGPIRLKLAANLPNAWFTFPFEWLRFGDDFLHRAMEVERFVPLQAAWTSPVRQPNTLLLNFWPEEESVQPFTKLRECVCEECKEPGLWEKTDLTRFGCLVLIGHGTEMGVEFPFRLKDGDFWKLPTQRGLPSVILLLACGDDQGNLVQYARHLLVENTGVQAVIAPFGRLDACAAAEFAEFFLANWKSQSTLSDILSLARSDLSSPWGVERLCLIGCGDVRISTAAKCYELPDDALIEQARLSLQSLTSSSTALQTYLNRLTIRCFMLHNGLDTAERLARKELAISLDNSDAEKVLLKTLNTDTNELNRLTQLWVLPWLANLAEVYDHTLMSALMRHKEQLTAEGMPVPSSVHHHWAKPYYRDGKYALALRELAVGLKNLDTHDPDSWIYLGALANIFVDLRMGNSAETILTRLQEESSRLNNEDSKDAHFKMLDRQARCNLRMGNFKSAIAQYRLKRHIAINERQENGERELAWLLYLYASSDQPIHGQSFYEVAKACLLDVEERVPTLGDGNDDTVYLLRALSAWGWLQKDRDALKLVLRYWPYLEPRLLSSDPGPIGFIVAFLNLANFPDLQALPDWEEVQVYLEDKKYYLELAALNALLERKQEAKKHLARFQYMRAAAVNELSTLPHWLGKLEDISALEAEESDIILKSPLDFERLRGEGMLPL